jgi:hypothetical protein
MNRPQLIVVAALSVSVAAWLVLWLLEGDACVDAGGRFTGPAMQCHVVAPQSYVPLVERARWPFWLFYGAVSSVAAAVLFAIVSGLAAGLRAIWQAAIGGREA